MNSVLWILISYIKDNELRRVVTDVNADSNIGQNYIYWNEPGIKKIYENIFKEAEVECDFIVKVEDLNGKI